MGKAYETRKAYVYLKSLNEIIYMKMHSIVIPFLSDNWKLFLYFENIKSAVIK